MPLSSAQGFSTISMMTVIIGAVTNIILDPIFIFGFNMGVQGAAVATILSQAAKRCLGAEILMWQKDDSSYQEEKFKDKSFCLFTLRSARNCSICNAGY